MKGMNAVVERHLDLSLAELESQTNADAIAYIGGILPGCDTALRDVVERCRSRPKKRNKLVVVLETNGGYISTVERMVTTIRTRTKMEIL